MGFKVPTVFVVGAGAHVDYGMPTGLGLIDELQLWCYGDKTGHRHQERESLTEAILQICRPQAPITHTCDGAKLRFDDFDLELKQLVRQLLGSHHESIDALLVRMNERKVLVGSWLISTLLLRHQEQAIQIPRQDGWHRWLAKQCMLPRLGLETAWDYSNVSVITFNYDNLFQYHMRTLLRNSSEHEPDLSGLPEPIHVYGSLDIRPEWKPDTRRYFFKTTPEDINRSARRLRLAGSRQPPSDAPVDPASRIWEAKQLVFLGFAFDPENMRRLGFGGPGSPLERKLVTNSTNVYATAYDGDARMKALASEMIGGANIEWGDTKQGCADSLRAWDLR